MLKQFSVVLLWGILLYLPSAHALLQIDPANVVLETDQQTTFTVSNAVGEVLWLATDGQIDGTGTSVTYTAPEDAGVFAVVAIDTTDITVVKVTVVDDDAPGSVSLENAVWDVVKHRSPIRHMVYSQEHEILWVATRDGLEERDAESGELIHIFTQYDGMPDNNVNYLWVDEKDGLWVSTEKGGIGYFWDGEWQTFNVSGEQLPDNRVSRLISDEDDGFWALTAMGVVHHNVNGTWTTYNTSNGLPSLDNVVDWHVVVDDDGGLWLGTTDSGVVYRDVEGNWSTWNSNNAPFVDNRITSLTVDENTGEVWAGTTSGLGYYNPEQEMWVLITPENSILPSAYINITMMGETNVVIGTDAGVVLLNSLDLDGEVLNTTTHPALGDNDIRSIYVDEEHGGFWVANNYGLIYINVSQNEIFPFPLTIGSVDISKNISLLEYGNEGVWFANPLGLFLFYYTDLYLLNEILDTQDTQTFLSEVMVPMDEEKSLPLNIVDHTFDSRGVWLGNRADDSGSVNILLFEPNEEYVEQQVEQQYGTELDETTSDKLEDEFADQLRVTSNVPNGLGNVNGIALDQQENIFVATSHGLGYYHVANKEWKELYVENNADIALSNNIISVVVDDNNIVWVATEGGLYSYDGTQWNVSPEGVLPNAPITTLAAFDGGVWIGTQNGLVYLNNQGQWLTQEGLPDNYITSISILEQIVVVGTQNGGFVLRQSDGSWQTFNTTNTALPSNHITSLSVGARGVWIGTDSGLAFLSNQNQWTVFTETNSNLPNNVIQHAFADEFSNVWIATSNAAALLSFSEKEELIRRIKDPDQRNAVQTGKRAAILVHPNGDGSGHNQALAIDFMARYAYQTLTARGFDNQEIYFLSYKPDIDINNDAHADFSAVDAPVTLAQVREGTAKPRNITKADVQVAFDWAAQQGTLDEPLIFIFIDHGIPNGLLLDPTSQPQILQSTELKTMLDNYQAATSNAVAVILEACHTGTIAPVLAAENRLIVTSTNADLAYYDDLGRTSFLKLYMDRLRQGENFSRSFSDVRDIIATFRAPLNRQVPQLNDMSGTLAQNRCLNGCFGGLPGILTLTANVSATAIKANTPVELNVTTSITGGTVRRVWTSVITPEVATQRNENGYALVATPTSYLRQNEDGSWTGRYSEFATQGDYVMNFKAEDEQGFVTEAKPINIRVGESGQVLTNAKLDLTTNILTIPAVTVGAQIYSAKLTVLQSQMPMLLQLDPASLVLLSSTTGMSVSSFNPNSGAVTLPFIDVPNADGGVDVKQGEMVLVPSTDPIQFKMEKLQ